LVLEKILPKNFDIIYAPFAHLEKIDRGLSIAQIIGAPFATAFRALDLHSYNCRQDIITYQKLFSKIAGLVTISKFNQEKLLDLLGPEAKINIIHSAIDPEKFIPTPRINNQPPKIITISRFVEKKGIPYLLEALSVLKKDGVNVDYTLIGDGPLKSDYESLIEKFNLKDTVKILPSVKQESIKLFLQQSDMMVLPCIIDRNGDRDIMANVLKEAMSMELPVITSNISGIEELIVNQKNGLLVPEKDVPALAEAIKKLINNSELRKEMGIAGRQKIITDFNIHQEAAKLNQFFLEIKKNNH
jgi:glycosyltransferase involved in cell wall biosynthesis